MDLKVKVNVKDGVHYQYIEEMKEKEYNRHYFLVAYKKNKDQCFDGQYLDYKVYNKNHPPYNYDFAENYKQVVKKEKETLRRCLNLVKVYRKQMTKSDEVILTTQPFHLRIVTPLTRTYRPPHLPEEWWLFKENSHTKKAYYDERYRRPRGYRIQIYSVINKINVRTVYWIEKMYDLDSELEEMITNKIESDKLSEKRSRNERSEWRRIIMSYHLSETVPFQYDLYDELSFEGEDD